MERRLVLFCVLTAAILGSHMLLQAWLNPRPPAEAPGDPEQDQGAEVAKSEGQAAEKPGSEDKGNDEPSSSPEVGPNANDAKPADSSGTPPKAKPTALPDQWATLGSLDPQTGYRMLVTLTNRGAAIERVELSNPHYRDLENKSGYLGVLNLAPVEKKPGARIRIVGAGTPAASASPEGHDGGKGLKVDDIIRSINGEIVADELAVLALLGASKPGDPWTVVVEREGKELTYKTTLDRQPLAIIRPEAQAESDPVMGNPPSCVFTFASIGNDRHQLSAGDVGQEIAGIPSLARGTWEIAKATPEEVEFRRTIPASALAATKQDADLEVIRRYRLAPAAAEQIGDIESPAYHVQMEIEVRTSSKKGISVAGTLTGPNNLPLEGWWYTTKISGSWSGCGARDIVMFTDGANKQLISCQEVLTAAQDKQKKVRPLFGAGEAEASRTVRYLGVDAQYFSAMLLPTGDDSQEPLFRSASAVAVGDVDLVPKSRNRTLNVSFELTTEPRLVKANEPWLQRYVLFAGPKHPDLLANYGEQTPRGRFELSALLEYGMFIIAQVARTLARVLHWIYAVVGNYGIAIILLTVVVRSCMLPISRKAAKNTQKMQQLAPEMKKIAELYKNDMEKRGKAQQELYRKYDVNPFGGCLLALCQLPIFIGLYRCLSIDIELRQAPLIPGWEWAGNLSAPDMLWRWKDYLPSFLADETGYLGPYFNLLPLVTIALFLFNQRMLTPPATDEQTRMQQKIMNFMTIFIGVMFFKVPAGLCIYFISSSVWSLAEHKLLRKKNDATPVAAPTDNNGDKPRSSPVRKVKK